MSVLVATAAGVSSCATSPRIMTSEVDHVRIREQKLPHQWLVQDPASIEQISSAISAGTWSRYVISPSLAFFMIDFVDASGHTFIKFQIGGYWIWTDSAKRRLSEAENRRLIDLLRGGSAFRNKTVALGYRHGVLTDS